MTFEETRKEFSKNLIEHSNTIVFSAYTDWLDMYDNFESLVKKAGFEVVEKVEGNNSVAGIVRCKG